MFLVECKKNNLFHLLIFCKTKQIIHCVGPLEYEVHKTNPLLIPPVSCGWHQCPPKSNFPVYANFFFFFFFNLPDKSTFENIPCVGDPSGEFQAFATTHPEYGKLFTTYLELQRYQAIQEATPGDLELSGSGENQEDSTSDKKDD